MSCEAPYAGLKMIDVSQSVAGPYRAIMLARYGANVITVEPANTCDRAAASATSTAITPPVPSPPTRAFLSQPHVAESGAVAWTRHPHMPQMIPLPNIIGTAPFQDGSSRIVAPSKGVHGVAILSEHGYARTEIDRLILSGVLVTGQA